MPHESHLKVLIPHVRVRVNVHGATLAAQPHERDRVHVESEVYQKAVRITLAKKRSEHVFVIVRADKDVHKMRAVVALGDEAVGLSVDRVDDDEARGACEVAAKQRQEAASDGS